MAGLRRLMVLLGVAGGVAAVVAVVRKRQLDAAVADFERRYGPT